MIGSSNPNRTAVVLAAGSGTRLGAPTNKVWLKLGEREVAVWSFIWLAKTNLFNRFVAVINPAEIEFARTVLQQLPFEVEIVAGGATRHESEFNALTYLQTDISQENCNLVLVHDAARPLTSPKLIQELVVQAEQIGGAIPVLPTNKILSDESFANAALVRAQTPQVFQAKPLLRAYQEAAAAGFNGTDTASCVEHFAPQLPVKAVLASAQNFKVTYAQDLTMAEYILRQKNFELA